MRGILPELDSLGVRLVMVGTGTPSQAKSFRAERNLTCPIWTDPTGKVQALAGLREGLSASIHPAMVSATFRALREGFTQGSTQGNPLQQGGVLAVEASGEVVWRHVNAHPADHASLDALMETLRARYSSPPPQEPALASPPVE